MLNDRLILFGVAALSALATAGWMRQPLAVPVAASEGVVSNFQPSDDVQMNAATLQPARTAVPPAEVRSRQALPVTTVSSRSRRMPVAYDDRGVLEQKRSTKESLAIIGGSAAAGAAIGGIAGGGKGAAIGALAGGGAGAVYDRMTAKKKSTADDYRYRSAGSYENNRQTRSTGERVAIIGSGAAAGAAVGGMAGGGKGAAIGALAGGAAGYIYDRVTKDK